jgi:hypothetical protein
MGNNEIYSIGSDGEYHRGRIKYVHHSKFKKGTRRPLSHCDSNKAPKFHINALASDEDKASTTIMVQHVPSRPPGPAMVNSV